MDNQSSEQEELLWTQKEVGKALGLSTKTVSRHIARGELPTVKIGRSIKVPKASVLVWIQAQTRYNYGCVGSAVQEKSICHINAKTVGSGGRHSPTQAAKELDALLEPPTARKRKH